MTCNPLDLNTTSRCGASQYVEDIAIPNWLKIKGCIEAISIQLYGYKISVRAAGIANAPLAGLFVAVDGIWVAEGDRILLTAQTNPVENGIWIVRAGAWTRADDFTSGTHAAGSFVIVEEGATYADTAWICSTDRPADLIDTDPLAWVVIAGGGGTVAGAGLYALGPSINVGAADASIVVNPDSIQVGVISDAQHGNRGGGSLHALATTLVAGFMSAADKTKLNGIESGATATPLSNVAPVNVTKAAASAGVATEASRQDHKHDIDTAAAGAAAVGDVAAEGVATSLARSDHKHGITAGSPVAIGTVNSDGIATTFPRSDHVHAHGNLPGGLLHAIVTAVAPGFTPTLPADSSLFLDGTGNWSTPIPTAGDFGRDYQSAVSEGESSTTSNVWQDKVTLTTPAMTGTYRLGFYYELKANGANKDAEGRCYNATDAVEVGFDESPTRPANSYTSACGFQEIVFTGAAKTFKIQWNFNDVSGTATIRRARLELWRVS